MITPHRYLHRTDGVSTGGHRLGRKEWVLSRGLVRFLRLDLGNVPASKRMAALELELRVKKPYADTRSVVAWQGNWALVFLWDAARVDAAMAEALPRARPAVVPESMLYAPPAGDGARLLRASEGFEGQYWQQGQLLASRWWPQPPTPADWDAFSRDAGFSGASLPASQALPMQDKPWARVQLVGGAGGGSWVGLEAACYAALAASLVYGAVDYQLESHQLNAALERTRQAAEQARARAGKLVDAREKAISDRDRAAQLLDLDQYVDPLTLLAEIGETLPNANIALQGFEYQSGKLKITLASNTAPISGSQMVEAMQKTPDLLNPKAVIGTDPKVMAFTMEVRSLSDAAKAAAAKAAGQSPAKPSAGADAPPPVAMPAPPPPPSSPPAKAPESAKAALPAKAKPSKDKP